MFPPEVRRSLSLQGDEAFCRMSEDKTISQHAVAFRQIVTLAVVAARRFVVGRTEQEVISYHAPLDRRSENSFLCCLNLISPHLLTY